MMICRGGGATAAAAVCRDVSLVDDASTVNNASDGETTIDTTINDPGSIRHENDMIALTIITKSMDKSGRGYNTCGNININSNNPESSESEHSRLLTDDDDVSPERLWAQQNHKYMLQQRQYQPLDPEQDRSLQPASSWSRTLDDFVVSSNKRNNYNSFSGHESVSDRFYPNFGGQSHQVSSCNGFSTDGSPPLSSYAFEMFSDNIQICRTAGDAVSDVVTKVFKCGGNGAAAAATAAAADGIACTSTVNHRGQQGNQNSHDVENAATINVSGDVNVLGIIECLFGTLNDRVDAILVRVFNVPESQVVQVDRSYTMYSFNDSTMTDSVVDGTDVDEVQKLSGDGRQQVREHQRSREVDVTTQISRSSQLFVYATGAQQVSPAINMAAAAANASELKPQLSTKPPIASFVQGSVANKDVVRNLPSSTVATKTTATVASSVEIPSTVYDEDDDESVQRFKEELYRSLGINIPRKNGIKSTDSIEVSAKSTDSIEVSAKSNDKPSESRDDDGGRSFLLTGVVNEPTCTAAEKVVVDDDKRTDKPLGRSGGEQYSSFSELHKKRVMQLVNMNRSMIETTAQRSKLPIPEGVIDLSQLDDDNAEFVPIGKTGLVDFHSVNVGGEMGSALFLEVERPDDSMRDVSPATLTPREEFQAMMKRIPKFHSEVESGAIDLTMYGF